MNIELYVVSLPIAKKLREAGYPQEDSLFWWDEVYDGEGLHLVPVAMTGHDSRICGEGKPIAAPISDEILEKLPKEVSPGFIKYFLICTWKEEIPNVRYKNLDDQLLLGWRPGDKTFNKLSDNVANLWLKLKEGGYIE